MVRQHRIINLYCIHIFVGFAVPLLCFSHTAYHKIPKKNLDNQNNHVITLKFEQSRFTIYTLMCAKDTDRMANGVDPHQTAQDCLPRPVSHYSSH